LLFEQTLKPTKSAKLLKELKQKITEKQEELRDIKSYVHEVKRYKSIRIKCKISIKHFVNCTTSLFGVPQTEDRNRSAFNIFDSASIAQRERITTQPLKKIELFHLHDTIYYYNEDALHFQFELFVR
jgi:hypothetical protein